MNPTNDPLIPLTPAMLVSILNDRKRREKSVHFPKTIKGCTLPPSGRLWYIAEFIQQARLAKRDGKSEEEQLWRDHAQTLAREVASVVEMDLEPYRDLLRDIANALKGKHLPESNKTDQQRVLTAVNKYCALHPGRMPTASDLKQMGVRDEYISNVAPAAPKKKGVIRLPRKTGQGRKKKN